MSPAVAATLSQCDKLIDRTMSLFTVFAHACHFWLAKRICAKIANVEKLYEAWERIRNRFVCVEFVCCFSDSPESRCIRKHTKSAWKWVCWIWCFLSLFFLFFSIIQKQTNWWMFGLHTLESFFFRLFYYTIWFISVKLSCGFFHPRHFPFKAHRPLLEYNTRFSCDHRHKTACAHI